MKKVRLHKTYILLFLAAIFAISNIYASIHLPIVEVLGNRYYMYEVKKGDSFFGISRQFGWNDEQLQQLNPDYETPLKAGTFIYYPVESSCNADSTTIAALTADEVEPITHLVKRGETVYGISMMYGIPIDKFYMLNPDSRNGIQEGQILRVKDTEQLQSGVNPEFYTIKKGDSINSLAQSFKVSVAALMDANPGISESHLTVGDVIKVPVRLMGITEQTSTIVEDKVLSFGTYVVSKDDTWTSIARKTGVDAAMLRAVNNNIKLKNKLVIGVPTISECSREIVSYSHDEREDNTLGLRDIYDEIHNVATGADRDEVRMALLVYEPTSRKDMDFTRGVLTAVNENKHAGYKMSLKVIEGNVSEDKILKELSDFKADVIIATHDKNTPHYLAEYSTQHKVPVVNVFDLKNEDYINNPYYIQLLTPSNYFNDQIVSFLKNDKQRNVLVMLGKPEESDLIATHLQNKFRQDEIITLQDESQLDDMTFWDTDKYIVYGCMSGKDDIEKALEKMVSVRAANANTDIAFVGRPNWIVYDESMKDLLHKANVLIPSRFYYDKDAYSGRRFIDEYKELFDMNPVRSYPNYASLGYDVSKYFAPNIYQTGGDLNEMPESYDSVQSEFEFIRPSNWSGFYNPIVYMVNFAPDSSVEKIKIK